MINNINPITHKWLDYKTLSARKLAKNKNIWPNLKDKKYYNLNIL